MDVLGVGPDETWMVGDNLEWEIVAPQRLGIYAIWHDGYGVGLPPTPRYGPTADPPPVGIAAVAELLGVPAAAVALLWFIAGTMRVPATRALWVHLVMGLKTGKTSGWHLAMAGIG